MLTLAPAKRLVAGVKGSHWVASPGPVGLWLHADLGTQPPWMDYAASSRNGCMAQDQLDTMHLAVVKAAAEPNKE